MSGTKTDEIVLKTRPRNKATARTQASEEATIYWSTPVAQRQAHFRTMASGMEEPPQEPSGGPGGEGGVSVDSWKALGCRTGTWQMQLLLWLIDSLYSTPMGDGRRAPPPRGIMSVKKKRYRKIVERQTWHFAEQWKEAITFLYLEATSVGVVVMFVSFGLWFERSHKGGMRYKKSEWSSTWLTYTAVKYILSCTFIKSIQTCFCPV